jgi:hypothetical protein
MAAKVSQKAAMAFYGGHPINAMHTPKHTGIGISRIFCIPK